MAEKKKKVTVNMKMDPDLWAEVGRISGEMGFTRSGFVEFLIRNMALAESTPLPGLMEEMLTDLITEKKKRKK